MIEGEYEISQFFPFDSAEVLQFKLLRDHILQPTISTALNTLTQPETRLMKHGLDQLDQGCQWFEWDPLKELRARLRMALCRSD